MYIKSSCFIAYSTQLTSRKKKLKFVFSHKIGRVRYSIQFMREARMHWSKLNKSDTMKFTQFQWNYALFSINKHCNTCTPLIVNDKNMLPVQNAHGSSKSCCCLLAAPHHVQKCLFSLFGWMDVCHVFVVYARFLFYFQFCEKKKKFHANRA